MCEYFNVVVTSRTHLWGENEGGKPLKKRRKMAPWVKKNTETEGNPDPSWMWNVLMALGLQ